MALWVDLLLTIFLAVMDLGVASFGTNAVFESLTGGAASLWRHSFRTQALRIGSSGEKRSLKPASRGHTALVERRPWGASSLGVGRVAAALRRRPLRPSTMISAEQILGEARSLPEAENYEDYDYEQLPDEDLAGQPPTSSAESLGDVYPGEPRVIRRGGYGTGEIESLEIQTPGRFREDCPGYEEPMEVSTVQGIVPLKPEHQCNNRSVCMQLLDYESGKPLLWNGETYWQIVEQEFISKAKEIYTNDGDSWCVGIFAATVFIAVAGCENVHIRCNATDVNSNLLFKSNRLSQDETDMITQPIKECLQEQCPSSSKVPRTTLSKPKKPSPKKSKSIGSNKAEEGEYGSFPLVIAMVACTMGASIAPFVAWRRSPTIPSEPILG